MAIPGSIIPPAGPWPYMGGMAPPPAAGWDMVCCWVGEEDMGADVEDGTDDDCDEFM